MVVVWFLLTELMFHTDTVIYIVQLRLKPGPDVFVHLNLNRASKE